MILVSIRFVSIKKQQIVFGSWGFKDNVFSIVTSIYILLNRLRQLRNRKVIIVLSIDNNS